MTLHKTLVVCLLAASAVAQVSPSFDAASIKPSNPEYVGLQMYSKSPGKFTAFVATVRNLVAYAYAVRDVQISGGPHWADTETFDIQAESPGHPTNAELKQMVQALLADRFHLTLHHESKEMAVYDLLVSKKGPTMTAVDKAGLGIGLGKGNLKGVGTNMSTLASVLSNSVGRIVRDRTELSGFYNFTLTWVADDAKPDDPGPSLFAALQEQLGLRLEATKGPVDVLVIDSVARPSAN